MKTEICRFEIELTRHNVTPAQFLAYARSQVDKKGGKMMRGDLDLRYFKAGNDLNFDTTHDGIHEKSVSKPYEMQTFIKYEDGSIYNEICEFQFDDDKTGTGYYYLVNVMYDAQEETKEETKEETAVIYSASERGVCFAIKAEIHGETFYSPREFETREQAEAQIRELIKRAG